jgi:RPA family protein
MRNNDCEVNIMNFRTDDTGKGTVQVKAYVMPEAAAAFKAKCLKENVSVSGKLNMYIGEETCGNAAIDTLETRRHRRKAVNILTAKLEAVIKAETAYQGRIPENLEGSGVYEAAGQTIEMLEEALQLLEEAY